MNKMSDFDREFDRMNRVLNIFFGFVAVLLALMLCGGTFVLARILAFFGIL